MDKRFAEAAERVRVREQISVRVVRGFKLWHQRRLGLSTKQLAAQEGVSTTRVQQLINIYLMYRKSMDDAASIERLPPEERAEVRAQWMAYRASRIG